jgi:hypothetical protein
MAAEKELNENNYKKIAYLLDNAIGNKEHQHPNDTRRAVVLFYSINEFGYQFVDSDVYEIIDKHSKFHYSETMRERLGHMANTCNDLVEGLHNPENGMFRITNEEQLNQ